jgi:hypothetical protein
MSFIITKNNSLHYAYKNHCYLIYKPKVKNHLKNALNKAIELCETMLSYYKKVFVVRVDLHPKEYSYTNKEIGLYLQAEKKKFQDEYNCKAAYFCAREQASSSKQHYHVVFMLSGHKIRHPSKLLDSVTKSWSKFCGGTISKVIHPYGNMIRGNKASIDPIIYRISYLTKEHSKENNKTARNFISSRLKPKHDSDKNNDLLLVDPQTTFAKNCKRYCYIQSRDLINKSYLRVTRKHDWFSENDVPMSVNMIDSNMQPQNKITIHSRDILLKH